MQYTGLMYKNQRVQYRAEKREQNRRIKTTSVMPRIVAQALPMNEIHDDISGFVFFEKVPDWHDTMNAGEHCKDSRLAQKTFSA